MAKWISFLPFSVVALSGGLFRPGAWYKTLNKPPWTPPNWLFTPAWTSLYLMMAVAGWLVWRADGGGLALGLWLINLVLNAAWSWLMFGRQKIRAALVDAVAMLVTILAFIFAAWVVNKTAALLFFPYLAWVAFAAMLNWDILRRNPQATALAR